VKITIEGSGGPIQQNNEQTTQENTQKGE